MYFAGLDLGTSGLKGLLVDESGKIVKSAAESYPVIYPKDGWSEQDTELWVLAAKKVLSKLCLGVENEVKAAAVGGQMHGLVMLDKSGEVIRPAILWNDGRTSAETDYLNEVIGREKLSKYTANIAFAGFTAPKILWIREHERQNFEKISKILLPKDYLAYRLTGEFSTDFSDASGTLLFDVQRKKWSEEACAICSVKREWLADPRDSFAPIGKIKREYLPDCTLVAGAGDNAAAAIGTGTVLDGDCNISLGTSGTVFIALDKFSDIGGSALHNFVHATGKWHYLGCILNAASANKWWVEDVLQSRDYNAEAKGAESLLGQNDVYFLPYLMGERSPHNDASARGAFVGMRANTTRAQMGLAVYEGVAFALRDCVEAARKNGINPKSATVCGGGAKSVLWKKILANVLDMKICSLECEEGAAYGAALLAMAGCGVINDIAEVKKFVRIAEVFEQNGELSAAYTEKYSIYSQLYPALKGVFKSIK